MKNLTAILVTFLRDEYLEVCVESIKKHYPEIKVIIGDQSPSKEKKKMYEGMGIKYYELEYDCGLCIARNYLINKVKSLTEGVES